MNSITFKGNPVHISGSLPKVGEKAPAFSLIKTDLTSAELKDFQEKKIILNIFPSLDTSVCATSVRKFNKDITAYENAVVLCISKDLPFAHSRFCVAEGINNVITLSEYGNNNFSESYGVLMTDGPLKNLMARAIVVINEKGIVTYTELVPEIAQEPNYQAAENAIK